MAVVLPITQVAVPAGNVGQRTSPNIAAAASVYVLTIQQVAWPHTGGLALTLDIQVSYDTGTTWAPLTSDVIQDEAMAGDTKSGRAADSFLVIASIDPEVGGLPRRLRLNWHFIKALTISGQIEAK